MPYFTLSIKHLPQRNEEASRLLKRRRLRPRRKPSEISLVFTHPETRFIKKPTFFIYKILAKLAKVGLYFRP